MSTCATSCTSCPGVYGSDLVSGDKPGSTRAPGKGMGAFHQPLPPPGRYAAYGWRSLSFALDNGPSLALPFPMPIPSFIPAIRSYPGGN